MMIPSGVGCAEPPSGIIASLSHIAASVLIIYATRQVRAYVAQGITSKRSRYASSYCDTLRIL